MELCRASRLSTVEFVPQQHAIELMEPGPRAHCAAGKRWLYPWRHQDGEGGRPMFNAVWEVLLEPCFLGRLMVGQHKDATRRDEYVVVDQLGKGLGKGV